MAAQQLMKKGKREVAAIIKSQCSTVMGHTQLNCILDQLLDPQKTIEDHDRIDWCRMIVAGGLSFEDFAETVRSYDNATMCGFVWTSDYVAYRCRTCSLSPCMSLCSDCFLAADHLGHDFNMFRSQAGGACDCGDASVMKPIGFCPRHRPERASKQTAPQELLAVPELIMPRLISRLVQHLRDPSAFVTDGEYTVVLPETDRYLDFLQQLSDMGAAMRRIITKTVCDPQLYSTFSAANHERPGSVGTRSSYEEALSTLSRVPVPEEFKGVLGLEEPLSHLCLLDELFFWVLKYEFPQKLVTLLLSMLPDEAYKEQFTRSFVKHYPYISTALVNTKDKPRMSNCVVHISVQLLSPVQLATRMVIDQHLLHVMLSSLMHMMSEILTEPSASDDARHQVVDCMSPIMRDHSYWPIVSDIINVFSHRTIIEYFLTDRTLLNYWARIIACFQGMNVNVRELVQHVEYEPESYYAAFSAELEISASPMWSLLQHLEDEKTKHYTKNVIEVFTQQLQAWFLATNTRPFHSLYPMNLSFHFPLHRYLSVFIHCAIQKQGMTFEELNLSQEFLQSLMIHPLQLLVGFHEIYAGLWVRNGLQIRGQAMTYLQCHFCNSTIDADYFLLQVIASYLDADHFVQTVLERFHVLDCLTLRPNPGSQRSRSFLTQDQEMPMLESFLSFLCMLLTVRTYSGESSQDVTRQEAVALLCIADRTHSQLTDSLPEKCGLSGHAKDFDQVLKAVSDYKEPVFEMGGNLQQGRYLPSRSTWLNDYDPLHVLLRSLHRRDFQASLDRYSEYVKQHNLFKSGSNLWPPFRIPGPTHPAYAGLLKLLHCRTMHGLLFTLLHKAAFDPNIPDAIVFYTVYLLELAITLPHPDARKREILIAESHVDKEFLHWFSSNNIFSNLLAVIPQVTVSFYRQKEMEMTVDVAPQRSPNPVMEVLGSTLSEVTFWAVVPTAADQFADASFSPGLALQPFDGALLSLPSAANHMEVVAGPDPESEGKLESPKYRSQGVNAILDQEKVSELIVINESMISLLLKLHTKLAGKAGSYVCPQQRDANAATAESGSSSRVGDGEFFVRRILNQICLKSEDCRCVVAGMTSSVQENSGKSVPKSDAEESRRKVKLRQERLMKDFASKQRLFMAQMMGTDVGNHASEETEDLAKQSMFDCCICGQMSTSLSERPIGMTALIQSSSVLGHCRHSPDPVHLHLSDPTPHISNTAKEFKKRLTILKGDFEEGSWLMALNSGWQGGVHVQTCGHYLHLDCHRSYISSLKNVNQPQSQILQVQSGEFLCPVCRQLSNTVLPIPPDSAGGPTHPIPDQRHLAQQVGDLLLSAHFSPEETPLTSAMKSVMTDLTNATYSQYRLFVPGSSIPNLLMFIGSLLRANLEMEIILRSSSSHPLPSASNLAQKKSCIFPLFHVLAMHYKMLLSSPSTDLWSHVTGVTADEQSTSLLRYSKEVPLLLKDACTMLIQIVLSLPRVIEKTVYQCVVQALYNVQFLQAIVAISCRFSSSEHEAWRSKGHITGCTRLESIMTEVIEYLSQSSLYDEDLDPRMPAICQSVWSPLSVEETILEHILPFLRTSAQLQRHLFDEEGPDLSQCSITDNNLEFTLLADFLGLTKKVVVDPSDSSLVGASAPCLKSTDCVHWLSSRPEALVQAWCRHLVQTVGQHQQLVASYRMLLTMNPTWYAPQLLALPKSYDQIFQVYRKKNCKRCDHQPKSPALCLVCGQLICYKNSCCQNKGVMETIQHSIDCGGGTAMFLVVNSSVIIIVRGPRAAIWGSVYLDKHGEEDRDLKRGKPLHLNDDRFRLLHQLWITHSFDHVCKQWIVHANQL